MAQTTLSLVLDVDSASAAALAGRIAALRAFEEIPYPALGERYGNLKQAVPSLHFLSISIFRDGSYDPIFVIEANFDGAPGPFWAQLEAAHGERLRDMLRCCKRPGNRQGPLHDAVTKERSRLPIAPYLETRMQRPSVFHHGNRGLDRDRILREGNLFADTRTCLAQAAPNGTNPYRMMTALQIHRNLRAALLARHVWLGDPAPARIPIAERVADLARLTLFLFAAVAILSTPGFALWPITTCLRFLLLFALASVVAGIALYDMRTPLEGKAAPSRSGGLTIKNLSRRTNTLSPGSVLGLFFWFAVFLAGYLISAAVVGTLLLGPVTGLTFHDLVVPTSWATVASLASAVFCLLAIVVWLRWLEQRDSAQDDPILDSEVMREMTGHEDQIPQNHMGSVVLVKPGVLRMALFRAGHLGLHLVLRVVATDGYLGSMRTVHFAHWAFVSNGARLMFFSNFDHSWDSYLDDFIEKAHGGLTLAWGSCVGFPATRFLVMDGASHGRQFKTWARHSMAVSRFWFSAYTDFTVDQIERQARIADGLRKAVLTPKEAEAWAKDL